MKFKNEKLDLLTSNIEFQLEQEGLIAKNEQGDIDFTKHRENNFRECRDNLDDIMKTLGSLEKSISFYNNKSPNPLDVNSDKLGLKEQNCFETDGYYDFAYISAKRYVEELKKEVSQKREYFQNAVKGTSARVTECLSIAWWFSGPRGEDYSIKISDSNAFIRVVSIVTTWSIDQTKKNVKNAEWFKKRKEAVEKGWLKDK